MLSYGTAGVLTVPLGACTLLQGGRQEVRREMKQRKKRGRKERIVATRGRLLTDEWTLGRGTFSGKTITTISNRNSSNPLSCMIATL